MKLFLIVMILALRLSTGGFEPTGKWRLVVSVLVFFEAELYA